MKGDGLCPKAPDDAALGTAHCLHVQTKHSCLICCWCGGLFIADEVPGTHGPYKPRRKSKRVDIREGINLRVNWRWNGRPLRVRIKRITPHVWEITWFRWGRNHGWARWRSFRGSGTLSRVIKQYRIQAEDWRGLP